jgi:hypothetical protein
VDQSVEPPETIKGKLYNAMASRCVFKILVTGSSRTTLRKYLLNDTVGNRRIETIAIGSDPRVVHHHRCAA